MRIVRTLVVGGIAASVDLGLFVVFAKELGWSDVGVAAVGCLATLVNGFSAPTSARVS